MLFEEYIGQFFPPELQVGGWISFCINHADLVCLYLPKEIRNRFPLATHLESIIS